MARIPLEEAMREYGRGAEMISSGRRDIYLARHGAIEPHPGGRRYIGQLDLPLSGEGIRQAEALRERLRDAPLSAIYCSDLRRSVKTAEIIADPHGITPRPRRDLREVSLGEWEGRLFDEVRRQAPGAYHERGRDIVHFRPPGGESFSDCAARVLPALYDILRATTGTILITGHACVNRVLLSRAMGRSLDELFDIEQDYGCLNLIQVSECSLNLLLLNEK